MYVERMKNQTKLSDSNFFHFFDRRFFQARRKLIDYDMNQFWWMDQVLELLKICVTIISLPKKLVSERFGVE